MRRKAEEMLHGLVSALITVHPHETPVLMHAFASFFFILSSYFVVLPLRDEGAISLGLSNLPELFVGSLFLTLVAAPLSTLFFSIPRFSKSKALLLILRFFSFSLIIFYFLWHVSSKPFSQTPVSFTVNLNRNVTDVNVKMNDSKSTSHSLSWTTNGWFYVSVRIALFLWVALLNLITISSTWARVIDVMDPESGTRLFGFIGAGATLGQLFGSLFASGMAWMGSLLLLFSAILMELAAQSSKGIIKNSSFSHEELVEIRDGVPNQLTEAEEQSPAIIKDDVSAFSASEVQPQLSYILDGVKLILNSTYLLYVSLYLSLSAAVSSFFYFQKVNVVAATVTSSLGRRKMFAEINSLIAIFILAGQLTLTGRILTVAGVAVALSAAPVVAFLNLTTVAIWPTWVAVAFCETLRKVVTYVVSRPGRELLFTVVSEEEKYKAKICIDVVVQRLGDATAAGLFALFSNAFHGRISFIALSGIPVCFVWVFVAFHVGQMQIQRVASRPPPEKN